MYFLNFSLNQEKKSTEKKMEALLRSTEENPSRTNHMCVQNNQHIRIGIGHLFDKIAALNGNIQKILGLDGFDLAQVIKNVNI